jgi:NADPH:quinone reductase-like Zn-dependent oxidoreductase
MGARRVVATGRNLEALKALSALGADVTIPIGDGGDGFEGAMKEQFGGDGIEVVLDYLWGPSAERILIAGAKAGKEGVPVRFVQIGSMSAPDITLPSAVVRATAITIMGSGIGSVPMNGLVRSIAELMKATVPGGFKIATKAFPIADVGRVWADTDSSRRIVFRIP